VGTTFNQLLSEFFVRGEDWLFDEWRALLNLKVVLSFLLRDSLGFFEFSPGSFQSSLFGLDDHVAINVLAKCWLNELVVVEGLCLFLGGGLVVGFGVGVLGLLVSWSCSSLSSSSC